MLKASSESRKSNQRRSDSRGSKRRHSASLKTSTIAYAPTTGPVVSVTATNPVDGTNTLTSVTGMDLLRRLPVSVTDPRGKVTTIEYDDFGRLSKAWVDRARPGDGSSPDYEFAYVLDTTTVGAGAPARAPAAVRTRRLQSVGTVLESWAYLDGLGRNRESQVPSSAGGRIVAETRYNDRGLPVEVAAPFPTTGVPGAGLVNANPAGPETRYSYDSANRQIGAAWYNTAGTVMWNTATGYNLSGINTRTIPPNGSVSGVINASPLHTGPS